MKTQTYQLKIEFITPILGSQSNRDIATQHIAKRNGFEIPDDEMESLPDALDQMTTVFHRMPAGKNGDETFCLYDYQVKGFLKEAGRVLNGQVTGKVKALRSKVGNLVFVTPRQIELHVPENGEVDVMERPIRCETPMGERVAIARSECISEGAWFKCGVEVYPGGIDEAVLRDLLDYGYHKGIGQWRGGGWGRFRYELTREEE